MQAVIRSGTQKREKIKWREITENMTVKCHNIYYRQNTERK